MSFVQGKMAVLAGIFMLSCLAFHATTALPLTETTEAEVWGAWTSHVDKFHHGDSQFLQQTDRYEAFRETYNFVKRTNARHAAGEVSYTAELNYRAAYLPHERTSGSFQPADLSLADESHLTTAMSQRKLLFTGKCGPGFPRCFPGYCCGPSGKCSKDLCQCKDPNCLPAYGDCIHSTATGLTPPPLASSFSVPTTAQASQFQYGSIPESSLKEEVDWRRHVNPVQDQGVCGNCWAYSASGAIEAATKIATGRLCRLSTQQLTDCSSGSADGPGRGCGGGFPDFALNWVAQRGTLGVATNASYPNINADQACRGNGRFGASIVGYGYVPAFNEQMLKRALQRQPVVVNIKAGFSFQTYSGGILDDKECGNEVDHAVLVVGYGKNSTSGKSYWNIMNSWGTNWGERGFIRVAMIGLDENATSGSGICGLYVNRPTYPILRPPANPCILEPCGGGICKQSAYNKAGYVCSHCPKNSCVQANPDGSQTCAPNPCEEENPCGRGTCSFTPISSTPVRRFSYTCRCPNGTVLGSYVDGAPTCTSGSRTYTVTSQDVAVLNPCPLISLRNNLTVAALVDLNENLDCTKLKVGQILTVSRNVPDPGCTRVQLSKAGDTCVSLYTAAGLTEERFLDLNGNLDCNNEIPLNYQVCLAGARSGLLSSAGCGGYKWYNQGTSCRTIVRLSNIRIEVLLGLEPNLRPRNIGCKIRAAGGRNVCVKEPPSSRPRTSSVRCGEYYTVQAGNSCWQIWTSFGLTEDQFSALNTGVLCDSLQIGTHLCVRASA